MVATLEMCALGQSDVNARMQLMEKGGSLYFQHVWKVKK